MEELRLPKDFTGVIRCRCGESIELRNAFYKANPQLSNGWRAETNNGDIMYMHFYMSRLVHNSKLEVSDYIDIMDIPRLHTDKTLLLMEALKTWKH